MSDFVEFACQHCARKIRTSARHVGAKGACPHCGKPVVVEAAPGQSFQPAEKGPYAAPVTTHANALIAGLIGAAAAALMLAILRLFFPSSWIGQVVLERGPIQYIILFVTCWGLALLALKFRAVRTQLKYTEFELDFIPLELGFKIEPSNVSSFLQHWERMPSNAKQSIMGRRIRGALEHFRERANVPEVQAYLGSDANVDASMVDSGYTLLRSFIWVVPLLGFIGTVTGISEAVVGLEQSLSGGGDMGAQVLAGIKTVTSSLAMAFDTTFLGLVGAIVLMFPTEMLKRAEYQMLDQIETFTNQSLLRRMTDDGEEDRLSPETAKLLEPVFRRHQQWLLEWQSQVAQLGKVIGQDFEQHALAIRKSLEDRQGKQADELMVVAGELSRTLDRSTVLLQQLDQARGRTTDDLAASLSQLSEAGVSLAGDLREIIGNTRELHARLAACSQPIADLADQWRKSQASGGMAGETDGLAKVLVKLDQNISKLAAAIGGDGGTAVMSAVADGHRRWWRLGQK